MDSRFKTSREILFFILFSCHSCAISVLYFFYIIFFCIVMKSLELKGCENQKGFFEGFAKSSDVFCYRSVQDVNHKYDWCKTGLNSKVARLSGLLGDLVQGQSRGPRYLYVELSLRTWRSLIICARAFLCCF